MAFEGLSTSQINRTLKDPQFSRLVLKTTDPSRYRKMKREDDKMNFLQRIGQLFTFDEWSDDAIWAMQHYHDKEGKPTPIKGWAAANVLPAKYAVSGARKVAGALFNSKKIADYESPRGRDVIPQVMATTAMSLPGGRELVEEKGERLDYGDFDLLLDKMDEKQVGPDWMKNMNRGMLKFNNAMAGMAMDTVGTPSFWVAGGKTAAIKKTTASKKTISKTLKKEGVGSFAALNKVNPELATQTATRALQAAGVKKPAADQIKNVVESSRYLDTVIKEGLDKGIYLSGPLTKTATPLALGKKWDVVGRYVDNPIVAAVGDAWGQMSKIPMPMYGENKKFGDVVSNVYDNLIKRNFQFGYWSKKGGPKFHQQVYDYMLELQGAKTLGDSAKASLDQKLKAVLNTLPAEDRATWMQPENFVQLKEYITGHTQSTFLETYFKNLPIKPADKKKAVAILNAADVSNYIKGGGEKAQAVQDIIDTGAIEPGLAKFAVEQPEEFQRLVELNVANEFELIKAKEYLAQLTERKKSQLGYELIAENVDKLKKSKYYEQIPAEEYAAMVGKEEHLAGLEGWDLADEKVRALRKKVVAAQEAAFDKIGQPEHGTLVEKARQAKRAYRQAQEAATKRVLQKARLKVDPDKLNKTVAETFSYELGKSFTPDTVDKIKKAQGFMDLAAEPEYVTSSTVFTDALDRIEQKYGMISDDSELRSLLGVYEQEVESAEGLLKKYSKTSEDLFSLDELELAREDLRNLLEEMESIELQLENGFTGARKMLDDFADDTKTWDLINSVTSDYRDATPTRVGLTEGGRQVGAEWSRPMESFIRKTGWERFLEQESIKALKKNKIEYEKLIQNKLKGGIFDSFKAMYSPGLDEVGRKADLMSQLDSVMEQAIQDSKQPTAVLSGAQEALMTSLANTPVVQSDPEAVFQLLRDGGFPEAGARQIADGIQAYHQEFAFQQEMGKEFIEWLDRVPAPNDFKTEGTELLHQIQSMHGANFDSQEVRKEAFLLMDQLEAWVDEASALDSDSQVTGNLFKQAFIDPMRRHVDSATMRQKMGKAITGRENTVMGLWGVAGRETYLDESLVKELPDVSDRVSFAQRKVFNEATRKAYNETLGEDMYKVKNGLENFAENMVGKQVRNTATMNAIHHNTIELHKLIGQGETGNMLHRVPDGESFINLVQKHKIDIGEYAANDFKKMSELPGFGGFDLYMHKDVYKMIEPYSKFYRNKEGVNYLKDLFKNVNNFWKGIQTGGGIDLPKIEPNSALYKQLKETGWGPLVEEYNKNHAFMPYSQAFTMRNFLTDNLPVIQIYGELGTPDELVTNVAEGFAITEAFGQKVGAWSPDGVETNLGVFSAMAKKGKETLSEAEINEIIEGMEAHKVPFSTYLRAGLRDVQSGPEVGEGLLQKGQEFFTQGRSHLYNQNVELAFKSSIIRARLLMGESMEDAVDMAYKVAFDYSAVAPFERDVLKPLTVFYTWTRKNLELMGDLAVNRPQGWKLYAKTMLQPGRQFGSPEAEESSPEWLQERAGVAYESGDETKVLSGWGGMLEAAGHWEPMPLAKGGATRNFIRRSVDMTVPTLKVPINLAMDRDTFRDEPIGDTASGHRYRNLPAPIRKAMGVKERSWTNRKGESGTTYYMDGPKRYALESALGRWSTNPAKIANIIRGDDSLMEFVNLNVPFRRDTYDTDHLQYRAREDEREKIMQHLQRMGLVSQYSGYGYNTSSAHINFPELDEYLRGGRSF